MASKYQDKEILDLVIGGMTIRAMSGLTFLQWVTSKLDGIPTYTPNSQVLIAAVSGAPMSNKMPDDEKVRLVRNLEELGVEIK